MMIGEVFRTGFCIQVVTIGEWSGGYDPPPVTKGAGYFNFRFFLWEVRTWW